MKASIKDMVNLDDSNYREVLRGEKPVLIDAHAPWCGPCKLLEPVVERAADKWKGISFIRYDVDSGNNAELKADLLLQGVAISSLPALILFMDGKHVASKSGLIGDLEMKIWISSSLHKGRLMSAELEENEDNLALATSTGAREYVTLQSRSSVSVGGLAMNQTSYAESG